MLISIRSLLIPVLLTCVAGCREEAPGGVPATGSGPAVVVWHNAVVHTMDLRRPTASALAFEAGGRIRAVGTDAEVLGAFPGAVKRDLGGDTVIPGLIDAHGHLHGQAVASVHVDLVGTRSLDEVLKRLDAQEKQLGEGEWLLGRGWDQNDWPVADFPTRSDLDQRFPDRPVWLRRVDGHAGWANSAALSTVDRDLGGSWQPQGGHIHRDASGRPTGILVDAAMQLVDAAVPPLSRALRDRALGRVIGEMLSLGLTGVHDPGIDREVLELYVARADAGALGTRVYAMADGVGDTLQWLCREGPYAHPSGRVRMRSVKLFADGALGSRGAALLEPYADEPGNRGLLFQSPEELRGQVDAVLGCGLQAAIHAIGDRANRASLDALAAAMVTHPANPGRHRIEHAQVLSGDDVLRFADLRVIASFQPIHATSDMYWAEQRLGAERLRFAYAWRSVLDAGGRVAFGSDFPVERIGPLLGIYAAVTRQDLEGWPEGGWRKEERVTRAEALRGFTLDAAYAAFMEDEVGSIEVGKRADLVVLDGDLMTVPAERIPHLRVLETWLDGERVYRRP